MATATRARFVVTESGGVAVATPRALVAVPGAGITVVPAGQAVTTRHLLGAAVKAAPDTTPGDRGYREAQHPRDRKGKWIEKGGRVKIGLRGYGIVIDWNGNKVNVRRESDQRVVAVDAAKIEAVKNKKGDPQPERTAPAGVESAADVAQGDSSRATPAEAPPSAVGDDADKAAAADFDDYWAGFVGRLRQQHSELDAATITRLRADTRRRAPQIGMLASLTEARGRINDDGTLKPLPQGADRTQSPAQRRAAPATTRTWQPPTARRARRAPATTTRTQAAPDEQPAPTPPAPSGARSPAGGRYQVGQAVEVEVVDFTKRGMPRVWVPGTVVAVDVVRENGVADVTIERRDGNPPVVERVGRRGGNNRVRPTTPIPGGEGPPPAPAPEVVDDRAPVTWAQVMDANDGAGIHGGQIEEYIAEQMGVPPGQLRWTREDFAVADAAPDPNGIRNRERVAAARRMLKEGSAPPIVVIEKPDGQRVHVDGWHRLGAADELGRTVVPAFIGRLAAAAPADVPADTPPDTLRDSDVIDNPLLNQPPAPTRHPRGAQVSRPLLYTYQRRNLVALGMDEDPSQPILVRTAAARIRHRQALSPEESAALARVIAARADTGDLRPVQQRAMARLAWRLDAAAAEAEGIDPPKPPAGRKVVKATPGDIGIGDRVALPVGRQLVHGTVLAFRSMNRSRLVQVEVQDDDGGTRTVIVSGRAPAYLLPDLPDPTPVAPPEPRELVSADAVRAGDTIMQMRGGQYRELVVTRVTGDPLGDFQVDLEDPDGTPQGQGLIGEQSFVLRTRRGDMSQRYGSGYATVTLPPDNPEPAGWGEVRVGDRIETGRGGGTDVRGSVLSLEAITGEGGVPGVSMMVADDSGSLLNVRKFADEGVTRLAAADHNTAAQITTVQAWMRRRSLGNSVNQFMAEVQRSVTVSAAGTMSLAATRDDARRRLDSTQAQAIPDAPVNGIAARLAMVTGGRNETQEAALRPQIRGLLEQVRSDTLDSLRSWLDQSEPMPGESEAQMIRRVGQMMADSPPTAYQAAGISLVAGLERARALDPAAAGDIPDVNLPDDADLPTRMATYRAALGAGFGQQQVRRATYAALSLQALENGDLPDVVEATATIPDRAPDGGPGATAMGHLAVVRAAGRDLDSRLQQNVAARVATMAAQDDDVRDGESVDDAISRLAADMRISGSQHRLLNTQIIDHSAVIRERVAGEAGFSGYIALRRANLDEQIARQQGPATAAWAAVEAAVSDDADLARIRADRDRQIARHAAAREAHARLGRIRATAERQAALELIGSVRDVGGAHLNYLNGDRSRLDATLTERNRLTAAMRAAEAVYPTDWVQAVGQHLRSTYGRDGIRMRQTSRGGADYSGGISLDDRHESGVIGGTNLERTAVHELGHYMERSVPGLAAAEEAFLWSRTSTGDVGARTRERTVGIGGSSSERGWRDDFRNHYTGRDYTGRPAYEVFTTGIEDLMAGGNYLDDDMRHWLLGTLALLGDPKPPQTREPARPTTAARRTPAPREPRTQAPTRDVFRPTGVTLADADPELRKHLTEVFAYRHEKTGRYIELDERVTGEYLPGTRQLRGTYVAKDEVRVTGTIRDADGTAIGTVIRSLIRRPGGRIEVHHDLLTIDAEYQGGGFANDFYEHLYAEYPSMGATDVTIQANIDIGGYAWAQRGFTWQGRPDSYTLRLFWSNLRGIPTSALSGMTPDQRARYDALLHLLDRARYGEPLPSPKELANALSDVTWTETTIGGKEVKMWPGKKLMLGSNWDGIYRLPGAAARRAYNLTVT